MTQMEAELLVDTGGGACTLAPPTEPAPEEPEAAPAPPPPSRLLPVSVSATGSGALALDPAVGAALGLPVATHLVAVYRVSSGGHAHKVKPAYVTKRGCLVNFAAALSEFARSHPRVRVRLVLVKDCCDAELTAFADGASVPGAVVERYDTALGDGAKSFNFALDALRACGAPPDTTAAYLVEDDYLHTRDAVSVILGGLSLAPYATGYDHPDKYVDAARGGNPLMTGGGEMSRAFRGPDRHWRGTNSTTMTFATTLRVLRDDEHAMRLYTAASPPDDFHMFLALGGRGRLLVSPLPGVSTHGETAYLTPFVDWAAVAAAPSPRVPAPSPAPTLVADARGKEPAARARGGPPRRDPRRKKRG